MFLKKIFKGVKKVWKKIGKAIKKVAMKIGKFMNKIGIVGQIALSFILPGIGTMLAKGFSTLTTALGTSGSALLRGVGRVLEASAKFAKTGKNVFKTVTEGITGFVKKVGGTVLEKAGLKKVGDASFNTLGEAFGSWKDDVGKSFGVVKESFGDIADPFKKGYFEGKAAEELTASITGTGNDAIVKSIDEAASGEITNLDNKAVSGVANKTELAPLEIDKVTAVDEALTKEYNTTSEENKSWFDKNIKTPAQEGIQEGIQKSMDDVGKMPGQMIKNAILGKGAQFNQPGTSGLAVAPVTSAVDTNVYGAQQIGFNYGGTQMTRMEDYLFNSGYLGDDGGYRQILQNKLSLGGM